MKETFYFQHDFNARNDPKLQSVLMDKGIAGIGIYWCIIEQLYEQGGVLALSQCKSIAFALHVKVDEVKSIINDFDLFQNDGVNFWSDSVNARLTRRKEISERRRTAALRSWESRNGVPAGMGEEEAHEEESEQAPQEETPEVPEETAIEAPARTIINYNEIVDLYHKICVSYPRIMKLSDERKKKIKCRYEEMKGDLTILETVFRKMQESEFMRSGSWASFDWIFKNSQNWMKVFEGNYDDKPGNGKKQGQVNDIWDKS